MEKKVKKQMHIKKFLATGLSAVMAGATLAGGALAATPLSAYPDFLGKNGQIDAFVVVGADAQPADIVGAGDVVAGLASLSYTMVSSSGTSVSVSGGTTEDLDVGTALNATTAFSSVVDNTDLPNLADSSVTFSVKGESETYDYHEEIRLTNGIKVQTGLSATSPDEDFKDKIFLEVLSGSVEYRFVFDESLKSTLKIINASDDDPITLPFMGRELRITKADADSITVDVGERFFLKAGQDAVTSDGKKVVFHKALTSGSTNKAQISIDGVSDIVNENSVKRIGSTEVKVEDIADDDGIEFDSAVVIVGTAATNNKASDTFDNGEGYIIPCGTAWHTSGCNIKDADWVWHLENLDSASPIIGVKFDERIDSPDDNPPTLGGDNNVFDLPGGFAWISLDSVSTDKYQEYEMTDKIKDVRTESGAVIAGAHVLEFRGAGDDDSFTAAGKKTDNIYFHFNSSVDPNRLDLFWEDSKDGNKIKRFKSILNGTTQDAFQINYQKSSIPIHIEYSNTTKSFNIIVAGDGGSNLKFYVQTSSNSTDDIDWVGHSDSDTNQANDILYGTRDISGWEEDTMTPDGLIVVDPDANAASDRFKIKVPAKFGSNDFQVKVTIGSSGTTTTTSSGAIKQLVPITGSITKLDTEVGAAEKAKNLVLVGGPAVNRLTAEAMGLSYPSYGAASGIAENTALIKIVDNAFTTGKAAVIVAGYEAENTRLATSVLQQAATKLAGISASEVTVRGASVASAVITPV
jgi:hypothetical protein